MATTTATGGATTTTGAAGTASFTAYRSCLQAHGVTFPTGGGFGGGFGAGAGGAAAGGGAAAAGGTDTTGTTTTGSRTPGRFGGRPRTPAEQKALTACASLRPTGGGAFGGGGGGRSGFASSPAFAKFRACLQSHGVQAGSAPGPTSTTSSSAFAACRSLLPAGGFGGGGSFGGGGGGGGGTSPTGAPGASFEKLQACLRAHGVQPGAAASTPAKTAAALAACRSQLPNAGNGSGAGTSTTTTTG